MLSLFSLGRVRGQDGVSYKMVITQLYVIIRTTFQMVLDRCVNENLMILCSIACTYMYVQVKNKSHVLYFPQISGRY